MLETQVYVGCHRCHMKPNTLLICIQVIVMVVLAGLYVVNTINLKENRLRLPAEDCSYIIIICSERNHLELILRND